MINAIEFYEKRLNIIMKEGELPSELQGRFSYVLQILQMSRTSLVTRHLDFVQKGRKLTDLKTVIDKTSYNIYSVYQYKYMSLSFTSEYYLIESRATFIYNIILVFYNP